MDKKVTYAAMAVIVIVLVAAIAVVAINGNDDDKNDTADDMTFLIQDNEGVYFWAFGEGETTYDAFADAAKDFNIPFVPSKENNVPNGIFSLWDLEMLPDWSQYWAQSIWDGAKWISSPSYMSGLSPEDAKHFMAIVYGPYDFDVSTLPTPGDAAVWDHSNEGMTFTIESPSSMTFQLNGNGETAIDAMNDAAQKYKLPFTASKDNGKDNGIQSLFGLEMGPAVEQALPGYTWWEQSYRNSSSDAWEVGQSYMSGVKVSDYKECLLDFKFGANPNTFSFLIQDDNGVYFWATGAGKTAIEAFIDVTEKYDIPFVATGSAGKENGINTLWNKEMLPDYSKYWSQYLWDGQKWTFSPVMMDQVTSDMCNHYMAVVYAGMDFDATTLETPADAVTWDFSDEGVVFTIQSEKDGPWFKINGDGATVMDAFMDATKTFGVDFTPSTDDKKNPNGIKEMFGLEMTDKAPYSFWAQYYKDTGDKDWGFGTSYMSGIPGTEYDECLIVYETSTGM